MHTCTCTTIPPYIILVTCTHAPLHTNTCTHSYALTHTHTHTHSPYLYTYNILYTHTLHTPLYTLTHTLTPTHARTHIHIHTHTGGEISSDDGWLVGVSELHLRLLPPGAENDPPIQIASLPSNYSQFSVKLKPFAYGSKQVCS